MGFCCVSRVTESRLPSSPLSNAHNHLGLQQRQLLCQHPPCLRPSFPLSSSRSPSYCSNSSPSSGSGPLAPLMRGPYLRTIIPTYGAVTTACPPDRSVLLGRSRFGLYARIVPWHFMSVFPGYMYALISLSFALVVRLCRAWGPCWAGEDW